MSPKHVLGWSWSFIRNASTLIAGNWFRRDLWGIHGGELSIPISSGCLFEPEPCLGRCCILMYNESTFNFAVKGALKVLQSPKMQANLPPLYSLPDDGSWGLLVQSLCFCLGSDHLCSLWLESVCEEQRTISSKETKEEGSSKEQIEAVKCLFKKWKGEEKKKKKDHLDPRQRTGPGAAPHRRPPSCRRASVSFSALWWRRVKQRRACVWAIRLTESANTIFSPSLTFS